MKSYWTLWKPLAASVGVAFAAASFVWASSEDIYSWTALLPIWLAGPIHQLPPWSLGALVGFAILALTLGVFVPSYANFHFEEANKKEVEALAGKHKAVLDAREREHRSALDAREREYKSAVDTLERAHRSALDHLDREHNKVVEDLKGAHRPQVKIATDIIPFRELGGMGMAPSPALHAKMVQIIVSNVSTMSVVDCEVYFDSVERLKDEDESPDQLVRQPLYCRWAERTDQWRKKTIAPGPGARANLFSVNEKDATHREFDPSGWQVDKGDYRIRIIVTAKDMPSCDATLDLHYAGYNDVTLRTAEG